MKPAWIQRPVLLILFSFLLSGCKGDMTDTGNETDVPDKNAVVTESMSEELPVEQTEESTSVLVQDLGELLCERDSVRDLMLVVDRRGLDDITVMTSQEERERILDELYACLLYTSWTGHRLPLQLHVWHSVSLAAALSLYRSTWTQRKRK